MTPLAFILGVMRWSCGAAPVRNAPFGRHDPPRMLRGRRSSLAFYPVLVMSSSEPGSTRARPLTAWSFAVKVLAHRFRVWELRLQGVGGFVQNARGGASTVLAGLHGLAATAS